MRIRRALGTSAATAVLVLAPQAAFADYGGVTPPGGGGGGGAPSGGGAAGGVVASGPGALPNTGSTSMDTLLGAVGLLLVLGGGATYVVARRRQATAD